MGTKAWGLGLVIIMGMGLVNLAGAADWSIVPSITQRSEFNSNLNMSPTNVLSDYIFSLRRPRTLTTPRKSASCRDIWD